MSNNPVLRKNSNNESVDRSSINLQADELEDLKDKFIKVWVSSVLVAGIPLEFLQTWIWQLDINGNSFIESSELRDALKSVGVELPNYKVRDILDEFKKADKNKDNKLSLKEFEQVYEILWSYKQTTCFNNDEFWRFTSK